MLTETAQGSMVGMLPVIYTGNPARLADFYVRPGLFRLASSAEEAYSLLIVSPACGLPGLHLALESQSDAQPPDPPQPGLRINTIHSHAMYGGVLRLVLDDDACRRALSIMPMIRVEDLIAATRYCIAQGLQADTSRISMGIVGLQGRQRRSELHQRGLSENALCLANLSLADFGELAGADVEDQGLAELQGETLRDPDGNLIVLRQGTGERVY